MHTFAEIVRLTSRSMPCSVGRRDVSAMVKCRRNSMHSTLGVASLARLKGPSQKSWKIEGFLPLSPLAEHPSGFPTLLLP